MLPVYYCHAHSSTVASYGVSAAGCDAVCVCTTGRAVTVPHVSRLSGVKQWVSTLIIELQQVNKMKRLLPCIVCDTHSTERAQFVLLVTHNISKHRARTARRIAV